MKTTLLFCAVVLTALILFSCNNSTTPSSSSAAVNMPGTWTVTYNSGTGTMTITSDSVKLDAQRYKISYSGLEAAGSYVGDWFGTPTTEELKLTLKTSTTLDGTKKTIISGVTVISSNFTATKK